MASPTTTKLDLTYPAILGLFGDFKVKGRTESQAFLAWFLKTYYRLEGTDVDDAICDEPHDKGVDGIYVSDLDQQITVFQVWLVSSPKNKTLGDTDLKEFIGTLSQLQTGAKVTHLAATTKSPNLKRIIESLDIAKKVSDGYLVKGVFITNKSSNKDADDLIQHQPNITIFDKLELEAQYLPIDKAEPIAKPITFDISKVDIIQYNIESGLDMIVAPLSAYELVQMGGIANQELFAWNLRYQLKSSPVNKEINKSLATPSQHKYFPAFHNGLTVLAEKVDVVKGKSITVSGYAVVNGCQSLSVLFHNRKSIKRGLNILTKFVTLSPKSDLALKITEHTNRQNGITARDLQSNNPLQMRLQTEIHKLFKNKLHYRVARGEEPSWPQKNVIENDTIARVLLAFDLKEPYSCHQTYRLFADLHPEIFGRPEVGANRIVALFHIDAVIVSKLEIMKETGFAYYSLTRFLFHYLLREALEIDGNDGAKFCSRPSDYIGEVDGVARLKHSIGILVEALMNMVDADVAQRRAVEGPSYDYRRDLKSPNKTTDIRSRVIPLYQMAISARLAKSFSDLWKDSKKGKKN